MRTLRSCVDVVCRTMQWFLERGFEEVPIEALPDERRSIYNWRRKSKIYLKNLQTPRDLDAEELFWNV
jgi:amino-acid N-acetyltransferase